MIEGCGKNHVSCLLGFCTLLPCPDVWGLVSGANVSATPVHWRPVPVLCPEPAWHLLETPGDFLTRRSPSTAVCNLRCPLDSSTGSPKYSIPGRAPRGIRRVCAVGRGVGRGGEQTLSLRAGMHACTSPSDTTGIVGRERKEGYVPKKLRQETSSGRGSKKALLRQGVSTCLYT